MRSIWLGLTAAFLVGATGCQHHNLAANGCGDCSMAGPCSTCQDEQEPTLANSGGHGGYVGDHQAGYLSGRGAAGRVSDDAGGCAACGDAAGYGTAGYGTDGGGAHGQGHGLLHHGQRAPGHLLGPAPSPVARLPHGYMDDMGPTGPPSPTYAYPYYTTRGPRDFLRDHPPSIGN